MNDMKLLTASAQTKMERISSRDPQQTNRYYHEVMRDALEIVKSAEARRKTAK